MTFIITPVVEDFAAEIGGLNLAAIMNESDIRKLRLAFRRYAVLVFRNQGGIEYPQLQVLSQIFGKYSACSDITNLDADSNIVNPDSLDARYGRGNMLWHMDMLVLERPPLAAMLVARELPLNGGGQTQFANLTAAYARLPLKQKRKIKRLEAVHSLEALRQLAGIQDINELKSEYPDMMHPLTCIDPSSGKKTVLFSAHTSHIKGLPADEGAEFLGDLLVDATRDDVTYTHTWQQHDIVLWSNWRTLHRLLPYDDRNNKRRLWRAEILSDFRPSEMFSWRCFLSFWPLA